MRSSTLLATIKSLYQVKRTICIEGPPGGGKTSIVKQAAESLGVQYIERHLPTIPVEDFGIPLPSNGVLKYQIPEWFPRDPNSAGILCFDDRNQATNDLQKVLANICQARNLHGHPLPAGWMVVSTGNRQSDRAGANRVLSHLRNRETVVELETNLDDWVTWAYQAEIDPMVISFLQFRPDLLHAFDPQQDANPTPRSWAEGVSSIMPHIVPGTALEVFTGAVGKGPATEFVAWVKLCSEIDPPDFILRNPDKYNCPDNAATRYAIINGLANRVELDTLANCYSFIEKFPGEYRVLFFKNISMNPKKKHLVPTQETSKFIFANQHLISGQ